LEINKEFNILFIQELPWLFIYNILSSFSKEGDKVVGTPNHPNWLTFLRPSSGIDNHLRVILYINICLSHLHFSLQKDIFNHRDICCFSFFNNSDIFFMINIYSDDCQSASKYFKNTEANLYNILIMASNFNIRDSNWDMSYPFYLVYSDILFNIADSFDLSLLSPVQQIPTQYSDNNNNTNLVTDLCFLYSNLIKLDNHIIFSELQYPSDHAPLVIDISIAEGFIQNKCHTIIKNSKEIKFLSQNSSAL